MAQQRSALMQQYWTSYKRWSLFFPKALREKVYVVYAFVRVADQLVDTPGVSARIATEQLETMKQETLLAWQGWSTHDELIRAFVLVAHEYAFERSRVEAFFDAMLMDTHIARYDTYDHLRTYMYGSAEVIGLMMTQLIGYQWDKEAVYQHASILGEAMQYTNFLRDIREDRLDHGRIYIPQAQLRDYGLTHDDIIRFVEQKAWDDRRYDFCKQQVVSARLLYEQATPWIVSLHKQWRFAVWVAACLYAGILWKIEQKWYDQFAHDVHTTKREKVRLFLWARKSF